MLIGAFVRGPARVQLVLEIVGFGWSLEEGGLYLQMSTQ